MAIHDGKVTIISRWRQMVFRPATINLFAAFSGGSSTDDVKAANAGLAVLKAVF